MESTIRRAGLIGILPVTLAAVVGGGVLIARDQDHTSALDDYSSDALGSSPFLANQEPEGENEPSAVATHGIGEDYLAKLAENLGISEDELREAIKQTALDLLDEAVADGRVPEDAAGDIREAIEAGEGLPFLGGGFAFGSPFLEGGVLEGVGEFPSFGGFLFGLPLGDNAELAEFLGISEEQLQDELNTGATVAEVGEAHGTSREQVKEFLIDQHEARIQKAIGSGKLDEDDAQEIRERFAEHADRMLDAQIRIHDGEGDPPPGLEGRFERWRDGDSRLFPGPWGVPDEEPADEDQTY